MFNKQQHIVGHSLEGIVSEETMSKIPGTAQNRAAREPKPTALAQAGALQGTPITPETSAVVMEPAPRIPERTKSDASPVSMYVPGLRRSTQ